MNSAAPAPTTNDRGLWHLLPQHLAALRSSGLSNETIEAWCCYSIHTREVLESLGFGHLDPPALALPIVPPDRTKPELSEVILKPDMPRHDERGRTCKYETRARARNRIHAPLSLRTWLGDPSVPLAITEGQKKAEKACQEGICCIALAGVWNWRDRVGDSSFPISDFELIPFERRRVLLCFDSDAASNPHVCRAEHDLAAFLKERFAAQVRIKRIPGGGQ